MNRLKLVEEVWKGDWEGSQEIQRGTSGIWRNMSIISLNKSIQFPCDHVQYTHGGD